MVNIYKFCKKDILIQQPGEPREQEYPGILRGVLYVLYYYFTKNTIP